MEDLEIESDPSKYTKQQWKKIIKSKINEKNKRDLLHMIKSYKKLDYEELKDEKYGEKSYLTTMNLSQARTCFAARAQTLRTVQMNFKHKPDYVMNQWKCGCGEDDYQSHLPFCNIYANLRDGLDIEGSDLDLVIYYQRLIRQREWEGEREGKGGWGSGEGGGSLCG